MRSVVIWIYIIIFSPYLIGWLLALLQSPTAQTQQKRDIPPLVLNPDQFDPDEFLDTVEEYGGTPVSAPVSEKDRRAEFNHQQAVLDMDFLVGQIDDLYRELNLVEEDIARADRKARECELVGKYETAKKQIKERDRLMKRRRTLSGQIHGMEKKLRIAQFKAGQKLTC